MAEFLHLFISCSHVNLHFVEFLLQFPEKNFDLFVLVSIDITGILLLFFFQTLDFRLRSDEIDLQADTTFVLFQGIQLLFGFDPFVFQRLLLLLGKTIGRQTLFAHFDLSTDIVDLLRRCLRFFLEEN